MKNAIFFFALVLTFAQPGFAQQWNILDLDTGKTVEIKSLSACQKYDQLDLYNLMSGHYCFAGDIKKAFSEIQLVDGCGYHIQKLGLSEKGIRVSVYGPMCVEYEQHPEPACLKTENQIVEKILLACDPKEKFFSERESTLIPFRQDVTVIDGPDKINDIYYSGDIRVKTVRRMGWLTLRLNGLSYGENSEIQVKPRELTLLLNPNAKIEKGQKLELQATINEAFGDFRRASCEAAISQRGETYTLQCESNTYFLNVTALPIWTLGIGDFGTSIAPSYVAAQDFQILNVKTRQPLKKYEDYTSLMTLWTYLSLGNYSDYCLAGNLQSAFHSLSVYRGDMGAYELNGLGQVYPHGIEFQRTHKVCAVPEERFDIDGHTFCPNDNYKVLTDSFFLKSCR